MRRILRGGLFRQPKCDFRLAVVDVVSSEMVRLYGGNYQEVSPSGSLLCVGKLSYCRRLVKPIEVW